LVVLALSLLMPAGDAVFCSETGGVMLRQQSRIELSPLRLHCMAISPDIRIVAGSQQNRTVLFWDMEGKTIRRYALDEYTPVPVIMRFSPDLSELVTAPESGFMRIYPLKSNAAPYSLRWSERATAMAFSPSGRNLAVGSQSGLISLWDFQAGKLARMMPGHDFFVSALAFSPDGKHLASGSWDKTIRVWDVSTGKMELSLSTVISPNVLTLSALKPPAAQSDRQHQKSQDSAQGDQAVTSLLYLHNGSRLACGLRDGTLSIWSLDTGKVASHVRLKSQIAIIAFSPDGKLCATGHSDGTVSVTETAAMSESFTVAGHRAPVQSLIFADGGEMLYSGGRDGIVAIWKIERHQSDH